MKVSTFSEIEEEFIARVHKMVWCSAATVDTRNRLRSRIMHPIWQGATGWVSSRRHALKEKHLAHNPYISLAYIADVAKPVYVDCKAEWADDLDSKRKVWELFRSTTPPLGFDLSAIWDSAENPDFGLLKLSPWRIELFDVANKENQRVWQQ